MMITGGSDKSLSVAWLALATISSYTTWRSCVPESSGTRPILTCIVGCVVVVPERLFRGLLLTRGNESGWGRGVQISHFRRHHEACAWYSHCSPRHQTHRQVHHLGYSCVCTIAMATKNTPLGSLSNRGCHSKCQPSATKQVILDTFANNVLIPYYKV